MSSTPRVAATRQRQREADLVRVEVLVPAHLVARIRVHAENLRKSSHPLKDKTPEETAKSREWLEQLKT